MSSTQDYSRYIFPASPKKHLQPIGFSFLKIYELYYQHALSPETRHQLWYHSPEKFPVFGEVYMAFEKTKEHQELLQARQRYLPAHKRREFNRANEERKDYARLWLAYTKASYQATLCFQDIIKRKMEAKGIANPEKELPTKKWAQEEPVPI